MNLTEQTRETRITQYIEASWRGEQFARGQEWATNNYPVGGPQFNAWCDGYMRELARQELEHVHCSAGVPLCEIEERLDASEPQPRGTLDRVIDFLLRFLGVR